jgi:PTH1 family peptidyl-tRNA hydrolase
MILIVGLGNPREKYQNTRHNIGFMVVDELARKLLPLGKTEWQFDKKFNSEVLNTQSQVILAKPQTMMNASGFAVSKLKRFYKSDLWVVHDDLDLPLGKVKIVVGHGSAGHHGIDSIVEHLGTAEFVRFRVGIGHPPKGDSRNLGRNEVIEYVLKDFAGKEAVEAKKAVKKTVKAIVLALEKGLEGR